MRIVLALAVCGALAAPPPAAASTDRGATALYMGADALIGRPILLAMTVVGSAVFLASLPFSLIGGNVGEAADVLVAGPARATFTRCLGCTIDSSARSSREGSSIRTSVGAPID